MTAIALAVFTLFIAYVMVWSIKNDKVRSIGEQTGWIRMRDPRRTNRKAKGKAADAQDAAARQAPHQALRQETSRFR
jgi:hypothetical protein